MKCGLTGRLPLSVAAPLTKADRKGPGLMGRLSLTSVRLEAACRRGQRQAHPGEIRIEGLEARWPALG